MNESFPPSIGFPFASRPRVVRLLLLLLFLCACFVWFSSRALLTANFLPHWYCLAGNSRLLWTTVIGDLLIGLSYVVISATLVRILRGAGQDLPYQGFFWVFGLFIVSCGITHFLEILTIWQPFYWLAAAVKILTAVSSVGTAVVLVAATADIISFARTAASWPSAVAMNVSVPCSWLLHWPSLVSISMGWSLHGIRAAKKCSAFAKRISWADPTPSFLRNF